MPMAHPDGSLMPDVEIELDTEDIRNGIDTVVETIVRAMTGSTMPPCGSWPVRANFHP
jgi:hypothetical protein